MLWCAALNRSLEYVSDIQSWAGEVWGCRESVKCACRVSDWAAASNHVRLCAIPEIRDHSSRPHMLLRLWLPAIFTLYTSQLGRELSLTSPGKLLLIEPSTQISHSNTWGCDNPACTTDLQTRDAFASPRKCKQLVDSKSLTYEYIMFIWYSREGVRFGVLMNFNAVSLRAG